MACAVRIGKKYIIEAALRMNPILAQAIAMATAAEKLDTGIITEWRSIVTLIVFVLTSKSAHKSLL